MKKKKRILGFLLSLVLLLGLMPGMSLTAYADNTETLLTTITHTGQTTYGQSVDGVVTVTLSNISEHSPDYGWLRNGTITVEPVEGYTITKCRFIQNDKDPLDDDLAPFSIDLTDGPQFTYKCSVITSTGQEGSNWMDGVTSIEVYGYAPQTGPDKTALNNAITAAETLYNSVKDNTDYTDIANTLKTAIDTAKDVAGSDTADQNAVDAATTAITTAKTNAEAAKKDVDDTTEANKVSTQIATLPAKEAVTKDNKEAIEAARAAYDALTDEQKSKIPEETLKKLTDAEAALAEALKNTGDTQQTPDGTKTVTKENADGKTILVTNYSKTDEQISQFVFKKANGTKLDLKNVNSKSLKTVVVPATVKANGKTYKVTRIRKGFLKNCKQATKVDIGKNINTIDKNAFNYGKKVQKVVIRGKLKKVGKGAFKNTKKNVVIKVKTNAKNFEKNKALLEKSGLPKNATVKRVKNKK